MRKDGETAWHTVEGDPPPVGLAVQGALDWERRFNVMRHHSALHVLVGVVYRSFNALVTGGAIYPDRARMDFSLEDLNRDRVAAIEARLEALPGLAVAGAAYRGVGIADCVRSGEAAADLLTSRLKGRVS